jgi:hypothetical protein
LVEADVEGDGGGEQRHEGALLELVVQNGGVRLAPAPRTEPTTPTESAPSHNSQRRPPNADVLFGGLPRIGLAASEKPTRTRKHGREMM